MCGVLWQANSALLCTAAQPEELGVANEDDDADELFLGKK